MFLKQILEHNPKLVDVAISLHQAGTILPDSYVIDVDQVMINATMLLEEAKRNNLKCLYMSKQLGRNIEICKRLEQLGFDGAVAVDFKEALQLASHGLKLYNVGHLVQIPNHALERLMHYGVEYISVYSLEKIELINTIANKLGITQKIMVKVLDSTCVIYDGQQGGFGLNELHYLTKKTASLNNVVISGVTSFPCFIYSADSNKVEKTPNFDLVIQAKEKLTQLGCTIDEVNVPSANITASMERIANYGATTVEPGHALTGTTPYHAHCFEKEKISICYVSEVSHHYESKSYVYGGGHYRRSNIQYALVVNGNKRSLGHMTGPSDENIDYYFKMNEKYPVGSTVIASFRTQIFTTRSHVVLVSGLSTDSPEIIGIYDAQGNPL